LTEFYLEADGAFIDTYLATLQETYTLDPVASTQSILTYLESLS
jgi:hypothetical protein